LRFQTNASSLEIISGLKSVNTEMVRVRSTARVSCEGDEAEATETTPISEVMRRSSLVVSEEALAKGTSTAEAEQIVAKGGSENKSEEDNTILSPMKPSHIKFEKSTVTADDMVMMKKLGSTLGSREQACPICRG
jgi:hypothetical protein